MSDKYDGIWNGHHDFRALGAPLDEDCLPTVISIRYYSGLYKNNSDEEYSQGTGLSDAVLKYDDIVELCCALL